MDARSVLIASYVGLALFYIAIYLFLVYQMKRKRADGTRAIDDAVNDQTKTGRPSVAEILIYGGMIVIAGLIIYDAVYRGGDKLSYIGRAVIIPIAVSIFNARKRTGRSLLALLAAFFMVFYFMLLFFFIGLPPKAPGLKINQTQIVMDQTTAEDLHAEGYDIYCRRKNAGRAEYRDYLTSGDYQRYAWDQSRTIPRGYEHRDIDGAYPDYLLVKNGQIIGSLIFYAGRKEDKILENSTVIGFGIEEDGSQSDREKGLQIELEGINLMRSLDQGELARVFGKKLWLQPGDRKNADVTSLVYGIQWTCRSDNFFFNNFYSYIRFDELNFMTRFELLTNPVR